MALADGATRIDGGLGEFAIVDGFERLIEVIEVGLVSRCREDSAEHLLFDIRFRGEIDVACCLVVRRVFRSEAKPLLAGRAVLVYKILQLMALMGQKDCSGLCAIATEGSCQAPNLGTTAGAAGQNHASHQSHR